MSAAPETLHDGGAPTAGTGAPGDAGAPAAGEPLFHVVRGTPGPEDVAALAAVLAALSGTGAAEPDADPAETSRRAALRGQARRRRQLAGLPGSWRSGRF